MTTVTIPRIPGQPHRITAQDEAVRQGFNCYSKPARPEQFTNFKPKNTIMKQITREALNKTVWTTDRLGRLVKTTYKEWLDDNGEEGPDNYHEIRPVKGEKSDDITYRIFRHLAGGGYYTGFDVEDPELAELELYTIRENYSRRNDNAGPLWLTEEQAREEHNGDI